MTAIPTGAPRASDNHADEAQEARLAFDAARRICRRHARSFHLASFFLPPAKRDAANAVCAFCRMMIDVIGVADPAALSGAAALRHHPVAAGGAPLAAVSGDAGGSCGCGDDLDRRLDLLRSRLEGIYAGRVELPAVASRSEPQHALHAFALTVARYQIPRQHFLDFAEGCRMDLTVSRYPTWPSLERHCHRVAGAVGLMMSCVMGLTHPDARAHAVLLGNAMRLTHILRDVKEDWGRGRIYIPLEDMARFRYSEKDLAAGVVDERFKTLMAFEVSRAREMYRQASAGLCHLAGDGSRLAASAMAVLHAGILDAIEAQGYDVFTRCADLTNAQKLTRLPRAWRLARRGPEEPIPDVF